MSNRMAGVFSNVSSENGGTARPGVACILNPGAPLATIATPAGASVKMRKCVAVCAPSTNEAFPHNASPRISTRPGGPVAVEGAKRQRNRRLALVKIFEQRARGVRLLVASARLAANRAEQRRRARGASQFLEHEHDFAEPDLGGIGAKRGEAMPRHVPPQRRDGMRTPGLFDCIIGRPAA